MRLAGKLCRRGAWIIAVLGLSVSVFFVISGLSNNQSGSPPDFNQLFNTFAPALLLAIPVFFFFLILYAAGALLDYLSTEKNIQEVNDERVEITSLPS
jgi:hypothetical protein